jgi:hypothetical protein
MISNTTRSVLGVAALATLSACPYDATAAGLMPVDGGYAYVTPPDSGQFVYASVPDAAVPERLKAPPTREQLCTLYIGDFNNQSDYPHQLGTWIGDVKRIFGEPPRNGVQLKKDDASISYLWSGEGGDPAGITLTFEYVLLNTRDATGYSTGQHFPDSYWLSGIDLRDGSFLDCWRWELNYPGLVPCVGCIDTSMVDGSCIRSAPDGVALMKCFW